jgi:hypothetical protein
MTQRRNVVALTALATLLSAGAHGQSPKNVATTAVRTIRDLQELTPPAIETIAVVAGYHAPGDGGGGMFVWQPGVTDKPDGGLVVGPVRTGQPGRWRRVHDGPISVRMFGAKGDGSTDDTAAIQTAFDVAAGAEVRIPAGTWLITRTLQFRSPRGRHGTGLKLVGEGMDATILDCRVPDGPALNIAQAEAYHFGKGGLIRDIEFLGRNSAPGRHQHGIAVSGAWLYRFERVLIEAFRGHGLMSDFVSDRGLRYSNVDLVGGSNLARRPKDGGFRATIIPGEVIAGDGIAPETYVERVVDDYTLQMTRPALQDRHSTLNIWGKNPDGQQTVLLAQDCRFMRNGGWGIHGNVGVGFSLTLIDCEINGNKAGGIRTDGFLDVYGGAVAFNGTNDGKGVGILLDAATNSGTHRARIEAVEIDGNKEVNLWLRRVRYVQVIRCRFNAAENDQADRQFPRVSVRLGDADASLARTVEFVQNMFRADYGKFRPHTAFEIPDGAQVDNLDVRDSFFWGAWSDAHHTRYSIGKLANTDALIRFDEEGRLAIGLPAPVSYCAQLRTGAGYGVSLAPGATAIVQFASARSNLPKSAMAWPMTAAVSLSTTAGSPEVAIDSLPNQHVTPGMPLLLLGEPLAFDGPAAVRVIRVASAGKAGLLTLERAEPATRKAAAIAGGVACPYDGYFTVEVLVDVLAAGNAQPVVLTLLADGKPWRTENSIVHGLASYETIRLSLTDRWPAGTIFHVVFDNVSGAAVSLQRAFLTVHLLT